MAPMTSAESTRVSAASNDSADARMAFRKRVGAEQHHGARFGDRQRVANADGVRAHQVDLEFADLFSSNADVAELAYAGGDRVGNFVFGDESVYHGAGAVYGFARVGVEQHGPAGVEVSDLAHRL